MFCRPLKKLTPSGKVLSSQKMSVSELHIFRLGSQSPILQLLDKAMAEIEKIMKIYLTHFHAFIIIFKHLCILENDMDFYSIFKNGKL